MDNLGPSFMQLCKAADVILTVTSAQRQEDLKVARHAETLRKDNVTLQDENSLLHDEVSTLQTTVSKKELSWQEAETERASLAIKLKLARAELLQEAQKRQRAEEKCKSLEHSLSLIRKLVLSDKQRCSMLSEHELQELDILRPDADIGQCDMSDGGMSQSIDPSNSDLSQTVDELDGSLLRSGRKWRRSILQQTYHEEGDSDEDAASPPRKKRVSTGRPNNTNSIAKTSTPTAPMYQQVTSLSPPRTDHILSNPKRHHIAAVAQSGKRLPTRHHTRSSAAPSAPVAEDGVDDDVATNAALERREGGRIEAQREPSAPPYDELFPDEDDDDMEEPNTVPPKSSLRRQASCASIQTLVETRPHEFVKKSIMARETCQGCQQNIKFAAAGFKCKECRMVCHDMCRDTCPLPCMPVAQTPQAKKAAKDGCLESFAPNRPPYVPSLVILCTKEVERRGVDEIGIYRLSGSEKACKALKAKLLKGSRSAAASMMTEDINVVACTLKLFLRELNEPLLPPQHFDAFLDATEVQNAVEREYHLKCAVRSLPLANQHTLAHLYRHLIRVTENSVKNKMSYTNLSVIFAITIMGFPGDHGKEGPVAKVNATLDKQQAVMNSLFKVDASFWADLLNSAEAGNYNDGSPVSARRNSPVGMQRGSPLPPSSPQSPHRAAGAIASRQSHLKTPVHVRGQSASSPGTPEAKQAPVISSVLGPITASAQRNRAAAGTPTLRSVRKRQGGFFANVKGSAV